MFSEVRAAESDGASSFSHSPQSQKLLHLGLEWFEDRAGGLEKYQHEICQAHARMGIDVTAWVQGKQCRSTTHTAYQLRTYADPDEQRSSKHRKLRAFAKERSAKNDFTLVSHHASASHVLLPYVRHTPHVVHFQGPWADEAAVEGAPWWKTHLQRRQEKAVYHSADRIITLSHAFADLVVQRYGVRADRVRVVPGAIDSRTADPGFSRREARERLGWPTDRPILLSVRRLVRRVGVDRLVAAVAKIASRHPDLLVLIGGTGPLQQELAAMIERRGLSAQVRLLGFVADGDLSTAYAAADYSIVPTQALEGFGLVTLESMAAGTPAIVTPVGSLPEVMRPLSDALVLPGPAVEEIAEGLDTILSGQVALPSDAQCRDYVRDHYDWSVIAPRVLEVYQQATAGHCVPKGQRQQRPGQAFRSFGE